MPTSQKDHWTYTIDEWTRPPFTEITAHLPKTLKVVYDVGANVGGWTEVMRLMYPKAQFYTFEPVFDNYDALIRNVPYATNLPYGIFYGERTSRVRWRGANVGAFFVEHINHGPDFLEHGDIMQLRTFEELPIQEPDLVKFDIEGAEENVIENSSMIKNVPWIIVEWHPNRDPIAFFKEHLPKHEIVVTLSNMQFLLCLK